MECAAWKKFAPKKASLIKVVIKITLPGQQILFWATSGQQKRPKKNN